MSVVKLHEWCNKAILDRKSKEMYITAGYGSGKTHGSWIWLLQKMRRNPDCKFFAFTEPTYPLISTVALNSFRKVAETLGMKEGIHYSVSMNTPPRIMFLTGQQVYLLSMSKPESLVGFEIGSAVVDEAALCKQEAVMRLSARLRATGMNEIRQMIYPTTPEGLNWLSEIADSDAGEGWKRLSPFDAIKTLQIKEEGKVVEKQIRRFRVTTYVNETFVGADYISDLFQKHGHNQNYIDSYVYGYFRPFATGLAYSNFKAQVHQIDDIKPDPTLPINLTWDYNITPQWVSIQKIPMYENYLKTWKHVAIHNANQGHEDLEDSVVEFAMKHPRKKFADTPILLFGDSTGHHRSHKVKGSDYDNIKKMLRRIGYKNIVTMAIKANPRETVSVNYVQKAFADNEFQVCNRCDMVLRSLSRTAWANNEKQKLDKPAGDTWTHPMDAVKYYFCGIADNSKKRLIAGV